MFCGRKNSRGGEGGGSVKQEGMSSRRRIATRRPSPSFSLTLKPCEKDLSFFAVVFPGGSFLGVFGFFPFACRLFLHPPPVFVFFVERRRGRRTRGRGVDEGRTRGEGGEDEGRRRGGRGEGGSWEGVGSFQRPISSLHDSGDSPFSVLAGFFFF